MNLEIIEKRLKLNFLKNDLTNICTLISYEIIKGDNNYIKYQKFNLLFIDVVQPELVIGFGYDRILLFDNINVKETIFFNDIDKLELPNEGIFSTEYKTVHEAKKSQNILLIHCKNGFIYDLKVSDGVVFM